MVSHLKVCIHNIYLDWADGIAKLESMGQPKSFPNDLWQGIFRGLDDILKYKEELIANGWDVYNLFGFHKSAPSARYDSMGLIGYINSNRCIHAVYPDSIALKTITTGNQLSFRRPTNRSDQKLIWEIDCI